MRTNVISTVTNRNVFGYGQDRVVTSADDSSCAHAAQHLLSRHASKRARGSWCAGLKRPRAMAVVMAGAARIEQAFRLAIAEPRRLPVRPLSPVHVLS
jgi:hypothetical protein